MPTSRTSLFLGLSTRLLSQLIPLWDPGAGKTVIILHLRSQNFSVWSLLKVSTIIKIKVPGLIPQQRKKKRVKPRKALHSSCLLYGSGDREAERKTYKDGEKWGWWGVGLFLVHCTCPGHSDEPWVGRWDKNSTLLMPRWCTSQCLVLTWADQWPQVSAGSDFAVITILFATTLPLITVVSNQRQFCLPGDFQRCLETFVVTEGRVLLVSSG